MWRVIRQENTPRPARTVHGCKRGQDLFANGIFNPISIAFFAILYTAFAVSLAWLIAYSVACRRRVRLVRDILAMADRKDLATSRHTMKKAAAERDPKVVGPLWEEFDETLVASRDGRHLYNTVEAAAFFNSETLALGFTRNRLLAAVPGLLAAYGVFGTFLTLAIGLGGLDISATGNSDSLSTGVQNLIGAAAFAFWKSVWGVGLSFLLTIIEKSVERAISKDIAPLQEQIDGLYPRATPEGSLIEIGDYSRESMEALQELHERIGDRLQETLRTMSSDMESAVTTAITGAMAPSMQAFVDKTATQSQAVFESLVNRFAASFTEIGDRQSAAMADASARLSEAIDGIGTRFADIADKTRLFAEEAAARQAETISAMDSTLGALTSSSEDLRKTAEALQSIGERIETSGTALGKGLTQTSATLLSLYEKARQAADAVDDTHLHAENIEHDLLSAADRLAGATTQLGERLTAVEAAQHDFQGSLRNEMDAAAQALREHVSALETQVAAWLTGYSADVEKQIQDRMGTWNSVSQDYASQMLATANALANVLDDIDALKGSDSLVPAIEATS